MDVVASLISSLLFPLEQMSQANCAEPSESRAFMGVLVSVQKIKWRNGWWSSDAKVASDFLSTASHYCWFSIEGYKLRGSFKNYFINFFDMPARL